MCFSPNGDAGLAHIALISRPEVPADILSAYAMTGELPKRGYPMRPDIRKVVGYIVTKEEIGDLPALRFTQRWPWR